MPKSGESLLQISGEYGAVTVSLSQFLIQSDEPMHPQCLRLLLQGGKLGFGAPEGEPGGLILGFDPVAAVEPGIGKEAFCLRRLCGGDAGSLGGQADLLGIGGQIQPDFPALPATQMLSQRNVVGARGEKNRAVQTLGIAVRHGNGAGGTGGEPGGQGGLGFSSRLLKIQHQTAAFQPLQNTAQPGVDRANGVCIE